MIRNYKTLDVVKILDFIKSNPQQLIIFQANVVNKKDYSYECHIEEKGDGITSVILSQSSSAYVTLSDESDLDEIAMFFKFNGAVREINGTAKDIDRLIEKFPQGECENYTLAKLEGKPVVFNGRFLIRPTDGIRDLRCAYDLLVKGGIAKMSFDEYYMVRRESITELKGRTYLAFDGETPVCTASSLYEMHPMAFLGGVATAPEYRNLGAAKEVVSKLCERLYDEGFESYISYKTQIAGTVYKDIGFKDILKCKRIIRK